MFTTFLDKLSGVFDRRFLVAYWAPVFVFFAVGAALSIGAVWDASETLDWWSGLSAAAQALLGAALLLLMLVGSYLLQAFQSSLMRMYQGYWGAWASFLIERGIRSQLIRK